MTVDYIDYSDCTVQNPHVIVKKQKVVNCICLSELVNFVARLPQLFNNANALEIVIQQFY